MSQDKSAVHRQKFADIRVILNAGENCVKTGLCGMQPWMSLLKIKIAIS